MAYHRQFFEQDDPYNYEAFNEGFRVKELSAFNIQNAVKKRKVNQHLTVYSFADGSALHVHITQRYALASMGTAVLTLLSL